MSQKTLSVLLYRYMNRNLVIVVVGPLFVIKNIINGNKKVYFWKKIKRSLM